jgi:putative addiction module component (TIGR02574 family)
LSISTLNVRIGVMSKVSVAEVLQLSIPERIQLVKDIWDSIASIPEQIALTPAQRDELERRLEDYRQHPEEGSPWEEVRNRILSRGE